MHGMNQGVLFARPLILGGLYLEGTWPRVARSVDEAWEWMSAVLSRYIRNDGGAHEGPCYLCQMLTAALWSTIAYCRARGMDWRDKVRTQFGGVESYIRAISATQPGQIIPSADSRTLWVVGDAIPILAGVFPGGAFDDILLACLRSGSVHELTGTLAKSGGMIGMVYGPDHCSPSKSIVPEAAILPESGKVTVSGKDNNITMRFWASSSSWLTTHAHLDHGQFCIEVDGDPIFIDRGMLEYWFTEAHMLSKSWLHNVLTPITSSGAFVDQAFASANEPIQADVSVVGRSVVNIPDNGVWRDVMMAYNRRFELDLPNRVTVTDAVTLREPGQVAFHLHSPYLFTILGNIAVLNIAERKLVVEFPWADQVTCRQQMTDLARRPVYHLCARSVQQREFTLQTLISCE
jgi:hypothetical protein